MSSSNAMPQDRIRIFDREGFALAEFRASVERSWSIGEEGRALFNYASRKTDIVNDKILRFGNWLLVENDTLPAWVGVLDTPRDWAPRVVAVHAYTPEHVFGWRRGPIEEKLTGSSGQMFIKLIQKVNNAEPTIIRAGSIWREGKAHEKTINPKRLSEYLKDIWEKSGEDYAWRPETDANGRLVVNADWVMRLGLDTSALLHEGKGGGNIEAVGNVLTEDGDIINDFLAVGDGLSWNSKPTAITKDFASIEKYGLRQGGEEYMGVSTVSSLQKHGATFISQNSQPIRTFHVNALNVNDTFDYIALGNILKLQFQNMGFLGSGLGYEGTVRITGMAYDPESEKNKIELVLEEVHA